MDRLRPFQVTGDDNSFLQTSMISSHYEYPHRGGRTQRSQVHAVPESSSKVISALRDLQEKIKRMELERTAAERRLNSLSKETTQYRDVLNQKQTQSIETTAELSQRTQELQGQLSQAESRCGVVEKQLAHMRKLVQRAEKDRDLAMRQRDLDDAYTVRAKETELQSQQDRLNQLERERQRLKVTQSAAEGKIRDLEERIVEEQHQRKLIQDRAAELQTVAETNRILLEAEKASPKDKQPKRKRKTKRRDHRTSPSRVTARTSPSRVTARTSLSRVTPTASPQHLRVNVGKIPFVAGQSTTPSHSINANLQSVLALMKTHNPAWCVNGVNSPHGVGPPRKRTGKIRRVASSGPSSDNCDLSDLLQCLQDEFGVMGCEHQELAKQIQDAEDSNLREDLERELDHLVARMELKGQQISKLKRHQEQLSEKKTRKTRALPTKSKGQSNKKQSGDSEVQVITTVRTKGRGARPISVEGNQMQRGVRMLRDMQTLQTSLRRDDLSWD
ncbi:centrosomal protein of 57 kDa-like [Apostichopus japonicus]|uniref:centrosomal protein of 57 kDa-like n=1 Tax=Stichopus japonicus TaxID=307972 RepID=UPI003AB4C040